MKTQKKNRTLLLLLVFAVNFISWSFLKPHPEKKFIHGTGYPALFTPGDKDNDDPVVDTGDVWLSKIPVSDTNPAAKNVFVQKIKGDNAHILIIAQYLKTEISERYLAINDNGSKIVFRDDGSGADKIADDGLYTAKIKTDVNEFKKIVSAKNNQLRFTKQRPLKFVGREIIYPVINAQASEVDIKKFDDNEAVPVTDLDAVTADHSILKDHSLMITDLSVVEDPNQTWNSCDQTGNVDGAWTFKTLMKNLASTDPSNLATDAQVSDFVLNWLNTWTVVKTINQEKVPARPNVTTKIIQPWLDRSFEAGAPNGQLDMRFAPFKLLAIVNRVDLRAGGNINAGEGRFIFCLINSSCTDKEEFNVIFEYGVPKSGCSDIQAYAQQWFDLSNLTLGSVEYNEALQNITDQFTLCGTSPSKPNQSSLNKLRTNEVALAPPSHIWELREFLISGGTHLLQETTVQKEPAVKYNAKVDNANVRRLKRFADKNQAAIKNNTYTVPKKFQRNAFLGGHAFTRTPPAGNLVPQVHHWDGTTSSFPLSFITDDTVRHLFSLNTCSGCHGGETQTGFTHVDPVFFGTQATLSGFLTGNAGRIGSFDFDNDNTNGIMTVEDAAGRPASAPEFRGFNDLERRAIDLENLVNATCGSPLQIKEMLMFKPLNMTH
ncbi:MAG TPA: hypothetical protein VH396_17370 [Chitinophagaceae bacterium]